MRNDYYSNSKDYINRWVISYADFVTMLLALFMVLYASAQITQNKAGEIKSSIVNTFGDQTVLRQKEAESEKIIDALQKRISNENEAKFVKDKRGVIIRINNNTLFDEGSATIRDDARTTLTKVVKYLTEIENPIIIEGHTDSTPIKNVKYKSNWELSTYRSTNIIDYLVNQCNIDPKRLSALGYGEQLPLEPNNTEKGRSQNRRVDIVILNSITNN